jgi:hypothetical protein
VRSGWGQYGWLVNSIVVNVWLEVIMVEAYVKQSLCKVTGIYY